ncbi:hypothetical protein CDCA_CDCA18G4559 [Cyanidium caldarium]|uniref:Uncharacterized protein n=1 Tax=Cyanidium caldarium TaxID=2771 RepID=A0AAV9J2I6_CYACA|nr:hypothetical protein CDCA_CDCA18G4559 [Cyanidium caldarium]
MTDSPHTQLLHTALDALHAFAEEVAGVHAENALSTDSALEADAPLSEHTEPVTDWDVHLQHLRAQYEVQCAELSRWQAAVQQATEKQQQTRTQEAVSEWSEERDRLREELRQLRERQQRIVEQSIRLNTEWQDWKAFRDRVLVGAAARARRMREQQQGTRRRGHSGDTTTLSAQRTADREAHALLEMERDNAAVQASADRLREELQARRAQEKERIRREPHLHALLKQVAQWEAQSEQCTWQLAHMEQARAALERVTRLAIHRMRPPDTYGASPEPAGAPHLAAMRRVLTALLAHGGRLQREQLLREIAGDAEGAAMAKHALGALHEATLLRVDTAGMVHLW